MQNAGKPLVVAVVRMRMIVNAAGFVIDKVGSHDHENGNGQEPVLELVPYLLGNEENDAGTEYQYGHLAVVVTAIAVPQRVDADGKCQEDHKILKAHIVHEFNTENR